MKPAVTNYEFDKKRFETFVDAIIAIILTILVLELRIPESMHNMGSTKELLSAMIPPCISYIGSFLLIFGIWIDYHVLFLNLQRLTKGYILMNMLFILALSFVPATTAFAGNFANDPFAIAVLFINYVLMNLLYGNLYWYAHRKKLILNAFIVENKATSRYSLFGIIGLIAAIPLAYVNTYISFALGIIVFSGHLLKKK
jgi:uncharacterized membrane protein